MSTSIDTAIKRGRGYWFVDGFIELFAGGILILLGGVLLVRGVPPQDSFLAQFLSMVGEIALVKFVGIFLAALALWWLKDRFTYPRTGFARGKRLSAMQIMIFFRNGFLIIALPVLILMVAFLTIPLLQGALFSLPVWFPIVLGVLWAVLCLLGYQWTGLRRFQFLGAMIFLAGIKAGVWQWIVGTSNLTFETAIYRTFTGTSLLTLISGLMLVVSGSITFLRYRKENPAPSPEEA